MNENCKNNAPRRTEACYFEDKVPHSYPFAQLQLLVGSK